ncbi:CoA pyrophosphatase [Mesobacillus maritimus]|uniref:NUDIX hydrolase n=1 Tax=Mesobacillus maritimus TaxID=1643336 RepID=UPI002040F9F3|nr:CoA pyrophosphatase [Mesobacillus maritimus]MCM3584472.1 CoA pyrophosphatase [Mesobacillus maritimus]MCM3670795.1 CoA pyrophosphatase [Mesobacillus maritimus]
MEAETILKNLSGRKPKILGEDDFFQVSVLLPLVKKDGETHILFEVRASHLRRQPNEVCFPGGKMEKTDPTGMACAIRETTEELGIDQSNISNVVPLDYMVSAFGTIIYPYVGLIEDITQLKPNPDEVGQIFTVPLSYLRETEPDRYKINFQVEPEDGFPFDLIVGGENYNWQMRQLEEQFYTYEGYVIWGLTARILTHFLELTNTDRFK